MMNEDYYIDHNLKIFSEWSIPEISLWLYKSISSNDFTPLRFLSEPDVIEQLQILFDKSTYEVQFKIKEATIKAIEEWREKAHAHGIIILSELSSLAALIRASDVIPFLGRAIFNGNMLSRTDLDDEQLECVAQIVAVVGGFAPNKAVKNIFEKLFFPDKDEDKINPVFSAQLLHGLCICEPESFPSYVSQFLQLKNKCDFDFNDKAIVNRIVTVVPKPTFCRLFSQLDYDSKKYIISNLSDLDSQKFIIIFDEDDIKLVIPETLDSFRVYNPGSSIGIPDLYMFYEKKNREIGGKKNVMAWIYEEVSKISNRYTR